MAVAVAQYEAKITSQHNLNLPAHAFWTANTVVDPDTGASLEYKDLKLGEDSQQWLQGCSNEMGRLAQGVRPHMLTGTNTIHFIHPSDKPTDRKATYLKIVAELKPHKAGKYRVRFTVGGNRIDYPGIVTTPTAEMQTVKLHLNSVISDVNASYLVTDINKFYLNTPMNRYKYMRIPEEQIPQDIMQQYDLKRLIVNNHVIVEIRKGMYSLPHVAAILC